MSYIRVNISDRNGAISGELHGSMTEPLVASLTAEPETIDEFEKALHRYVKSESDWPPLHRFSKHEDLEPFDAGVVAIDLAGRLIGYESTYSYPSMEGSVKVPNGFADEPDEEIRIPYRLPDDWLLIRSIPLFEGMRDRKLEERMRTAPFDARPILFGRPLSIFIAREIGPANELESEDLFSDIHARWLMTPRSDLRGKTPREVLLEKRHFIDFDLHTRSLQWSFTKVCPPPLGRDSFAYLNAGFGTHENVLYYELVRFLIGECLEHRDAGLDITGEEEVERLKEARNRWMRTPDSDSWGRLPVDIIDLERRRTNMTVSAQEALIDENCPCCVAMAEDFDTPMFWHLDGCNMDDRFEFSFFNIREEWEADRRQMEEFSREFNEKWEKERSRSGIEADNEEPF